MPGVDGLHGVAEIIDHTSEGVEAPALAAFALPHFAVVFKRAEGNEGVVARAASQHLCPRMANVAVTCTVLSAFFLLVNYSQCLARLTHGLFGRAVVIVEFTAQQAQPVL